MTVTVTALLNMKVKIVQIKTYDGYIDGTAQHEGENSPD